MKPQRREPSPERQTPGTWPQSALVLLFVASGCSALVYELVWFQLLELVVGSSAISLGILLAVFMGGMGLGSLLLPRVVPPGRHPLRVYAAIELGIGVLGVLALVEVPFLGGLYTGSGAHGLLSVVLRAMLAGACLLPPTVLMGAALPAVARGVESSPEGTSRLGALYAANVAGAVAGALLAGFHLLRLHTMGYATAVAVALNLLVALVALALARRPVRRAGAAAPEAAGAKGPAGPGRGVVIAVTALSGLTALGAEVLWTRLLSLLIGATVYTFSIILAVFLFGMGLGSALGAARARTSRDPLRDLGFCQLLLAGAVWWAAYMQLASMPFWPILGSLSVSPLVEFQMDCVRCLWAILPAAMVWGASFPLALAAASGRDRDAGRLVSVVYVANTAGSIVGAMLFTFWVVPALGSQAAQRLLVALAAFSGLVALVPALRERGPARTRTALVAAAALVVAGVLLARVPPLPGGLVVYGRGLAYRLGAHDPRTGALVGLPDILYVGEGMNESVAVSDDRESRVFSVSGKVEASTARTDMRLQRMLGDLPALVHPGPRSALIVGFGAGVTSGCFVQYPTIRRIVICELEPLVPQKIGPYFAEANHDVVHDPRVQVVYDDARHFMATSREKFDIITSDPIHPWVKGSAVLYSKDYFDLVRQHLNPGGLVTQWLPLYQSSEATIQGEIATFFAAFPGGSVWANNDDRGRGYDMVLLGGPGVGPIDLDSLDARYRSPGYAGVAASLAAIGCNSVFDLLSTYAGRQVDLAPWLEGARINDDHQLWLQYQAALETFTEDEVSIYEHMSQYRSFPQDLFVGSPAMRQRMLSGGAPPPPANAAIPEHVPVASPRVPRH